MGQILMRPGGKKLDVDRSFSDGGEPARYALMGGERVLVKDGAPARPDIYQRGRAFFYGDGLPVQSEDDVTHLPEPYRSQALEFIRSGAKARPPTTIRKSSMPEPRTIEMRPEEALGPEALTPSRA